MVDFQYLVAWFKSRELVLNTMNAKTWGAFREWIIKDVKEVEQKPILFLDMEQRLGHEYYTRMLKMMSSGMINEQITQYVAIIKSASGNEVLEWTWLVVAC